MHYASDMTLIFTTPSDQAYISLGVRPPGQGWFSFDVLVPEARKGRATKFVMAMWNAYRCKDAPSALVPAVQRDRATGSYWYKVNRVKTDERGTKRTALWNAIALADKMVPMFGMLKDVTSKRASLDYVFGIDRVVYEADGRVVREADASAVWLRLHPAPDQGVGCDVETCDVPTLGTQNGPAQ